MRLKQFLFFGALTTVLAGKIASALPGGILLPLHLCSILVGSHHDVLHPFPVEEISDVQFRSASISTDSGVLATIDHKWLFGGEKASPPIRWGVSLHWLDDPARSTHIALPDETRHGEVRENSFHNHVAVSPDGYTYAHGVVDSQVWVRQLADGEVLRKLGTVHGNPDGSDKRTIMKMLYSPNGRYLAVRYMGTYEVQKRKDLGSVSVYDLHSDRNVPVVTFDCESYALTEHYPKFLFSDDERFFIHGAQGEITAYDLTARTASSRGQALVQPEDYTAAFRVEDMKFLPGSHRLFYVDPGGLYEWDLGTTGSSPVLFLPNSAPGYQSGGSGQTYLDFSADGKSFVHYGERGTIVYERESRNVLFSLGTDEIPTEGFFTKDTKSPYAGLVTTLRDNKSANVYTIRFWNVSDGSLAYEFAFPSEDSIKQVSRSRNGRRVIVRQEAERYRSKFSALVDSLRVFDVERAMGDRATHREKILSVTVSVATRALVLKTIAADETPKTRQIEFEDLQKLFDQETLLGSNEEHGETASIDDVTVSPDSRTVTVTASRQDGSRRTRSVPVEAVFKE
jgi:WD40 repeat protein